MNYVVYFSSFCLFSPFPVRRRFDLQNSSRTERNVEMFSTMERALVQVTQQHKLSTWVYNSPGLVCMSPASLHEVKQCFHWCGQNNCLARPVVYLDTALDQELASRLSNVIIKHQVSWCWLGFNDGVFPLSLPQSVILTRKNPASGLSNRGPSACQSSPLPINTIINRRRYGHNSGFML